MICDLNHCCSSFYKKSIHIDRSVWAAKGSGLGQSSSDLPAKPPVGAGERGRLDVGVVCPENEIGLDVRYVLCEPSSVGQWGGGVVLAMPQWTGTVIVP